MSVSRLASDQAVRNFLGDLEGTYRSLSQAQRQVSTGKRVLSPVRKTATAPKAGPRSMMTLRP